jgi:cobyric acid synthase
LPEYNTALPATYREYKEREYDNLAAVVRENIDLAEVYRIIGGK